MTGNLFGRLADWEMEHRRWMFLALALGSIAAGYGLVHLRFDFRPEALLEFDAEEEAFSNSFKSEFQVPENILILVLKGSRPGSVLDPRGLTLLHRLTRTAAESEISARTISLTTLPSRDSATGLAALTLGRLPPLVQSLPVTPEVAERARRQVEQSRLIPGQLVSEDGSTAAIAIVPHPRYEDHSVLDRPLAELEEKVRLLLRSEAASLTVPGSETAVRYETHLGGLPYVRVETVRNLKTEQRTFWPMIAVLYVSVLWLIYRDLLLAIVPLAAVGLASLWNLALLPLTGSMVNVVNNIVPSLILVIGVCNAVHMLHGYRQVRRSGLDGPAATRAMMEELGLPTFLTSLTTAVGFGSLLVARNEVLRDLGWQAAAGIMLSWVALVTLLPLILRHFSGRIRIRSFDWERQIELPWLDRTVARIGARPWLTVLLSLVVLAAAVALGSRVPVDATMLETFPPGHPIYESNRLVEEELGGILPLEIELSAEKPDFFGDPDHLRQVFAIQHELAAMPGVLHVSSPVDLLAEVQNVRDDDGVPATLTAPKVNFAFGMLRSLQPEALAQYLSADRQRLRLAARLADDGIQASLRLLAEIEKNRSRWLEPFGGEVAMRLTGQAYLAARGLDFFIRDLFLSLVTASVVIFLVLVVIFRSLRIGLLSVLPTILPLAVTLGLIPVYGYQLNTTTTVVFTITIGMAVDNTIHLLARFLISRREGLALLPAIQRTFRRAGAAVVASNLLLIAGFAILFTSDFEPVFRVAVLTCTTIAAALFAAILVLPGLLTLWGEPIGADAPTSVPAPPGSPASV